MATPATRISVEEFSQLRLAETEDYELVEGELVPLSSGTPKHAKLRQNLELALALYFSRVKSGLVLAEVDCRLGEGSVRRPDLSVFLGSHATEFDWQRIPIPFAPDIAVEVLSPHELAVDVHRKALEYLAAGAQEVWLLDEANGEIFLQTDAGIRLLRGADLVQTPLLPGFGAVTRELLSA